MLAKVQEFGFLRVCVRWATAVDARNLPAGVWTGIVMKVCCHGLSVAQLGPGMMAESHLPGLDAQHKEKGRHVVGDGAPCNFCADADMRLFDLGISPR